MLPGTVFRKPFWMEIEMSEILMMSTTDSAELAHTIASALVESRLAACVSILPGMRSVYRWEGRLCDDAEWLLLVKTSEACFEGVRSEIRRLHTYQVPEILALPIRAGDGDYLRWLADQVRA